MKYLRVEIMTFIGVLGSMLSYLFGGFTEALVALCIMMVIDVILGFTNALIFHKSKKTENGRASSSQGIKGITKKIIILFIVVVAHQLDIIMGVNFIKDGVIIAYATMEGLSIVENMGFMGIPVPKVVKDALEILNKKEKDETSKEDQE